MWFAFKPVAFDTYQGPVPFAHRENATSVASEKTPSLKFVFRADASVQIGTGHVMRCLTLADELSRLGHACWFLCREHQGHLGDLITSRGHKLALLSNPVESLTADNGGGRMITLPGWVWDGKTMHNKRVTLSRRYQPTG